MTDPNSAAWPALRQRIRDSTVSVRSLPATRDGTDLLDALGITEHSTLGALVAHTGGLVIDEGWLRILGGGTTGLPDLVQANAIRDTAPPAFLRIAHDALGGQFAIDGGGLGIAPGEVCYFGPDTLAWTGIGCGHTAFVHWALEGGLHDFYADLRWAGWEREVAELRLDQGLSVFPPPFTAEGQNIGSASRRPIPLAELTAFYADMARQLVDHEDGARFRMVISNDTDGEPGPGA